MKRLGLGAAAITAGALMLAGCSGPANNTVNGDANNQLTYDAGNCTSFYVWSSPEKVAAMIDFAKAFKEHSEKQDPNNCYAPQVISVSSGDAAKYLEGTATNANLPQPALWSPASSVWVDYVSQSTDHIIGKWQSFAKTPVVLAMPEPMARQLGWPGDVSMQKLHDVCLSGWTGFGGAAATWGDFKLFKTNPTSSTTGLNMVLMQAYANAKKAKDLTVNDIKAASSFSKDIETCAPHYGDTTGAVLQRIADVENPLTYASAVAVEEKSIIDYNLGNPNGDVVVDNSQLKVPAEKLVAVYLSGGSLVSDNPTVTLGAKATWVTPELRTGADQFAAYLQTDAVQDKLDDYGFRPIDAHKPLAGLLASENGVNAKQKITYLEKPSADVAAAAIQQWENIRKPSSVMFLLDGSGSMNDRAQGTSSSYLQGAKDAANAAVKLLRPTDKLAIDVFMDNTMAEVRSVSPIGNDVESNTLANTINGIAADGGTPLYDSVWAAYQKMEAQAEPGRINAIVLLSDGDDTTSRDVRTADMLVKKIEESIGENANRAGHVMIFPVYYGKAAPVAELQKLAQATGGQAIDATDASLITEKMLKAFRNF